MSHRLISLNDDLRRLRDEGYEVAVREGNLLVLGHVPYVTASREVKLGTLVSNLELAGDRTTRPSQHIAHFVGEHPCDQGGARISQIEHGGRQDLGGGIVAHFSFSNKPAEGYGDYHHKMTTYVRILSGPAQALDASATATTFAKAHLENEEDAVHVYADTSSSRAQINAVSEKLKGRNVGIVGLGGTGAYVLDLLAKTWVQEIHLYDADRFVQHNAFRAPGAASAELFDDPPYKTDYYKSIYSRMHRRIHSHPIFIDSRSVEQLDQVGFVFVCVDRGDARRVIVDHLQRLGTEFVDVGMGVHEIDGSLLGIVRTTWSTPAVAARVRSQLPFDSATDDAYRTNVQIADLNMLNAALAVIAWKKLRGFYADAVRERHTTYTINANMLLSEEHEA